MKDSLEDLREFHRKIGATVAEKPTRPTIDHRFSRVVSIVTNAATTIIHEHEAMRTGTSPDGPGLAILRVRLMVEELMETVQAMYHNDMVGFADGLADLQYVVKGTAVAYGIPLDAVHKVVHASNMSKTGQDEHSKGGKGKGYVDPFPEINRLVNG